jgi:3-methyladenine DNA glycosylase AlkC
MAEDAMKSVSAGEVCAPAFDLAVLDPWEEKQNRRRYTIRKWTRADAESAMARVLAPNLTNNISRADILAHIEEVASPEYVIIH